ncbi:MAG: OmpA family protein [Elusimicrobiota bacterium]
MPSGLPRSERSITALVGAAVFVLAAAAWSAPSGTVPNIKPLIWDDCPEYTRFEEDLGGKPVRVPLISPHKLKKMMREGEPVYLLDVRSPHDFSYDHLAGARSVPVEEILAVELPKDHLLVLYCSVCCCPEVPVAARVLLERGHNKLAVLRAGLEETGELVVWKAGNSALQKPDNFIQLGCGKARNEVKSLKRRMELKEIPAIEFELGRAVLREYSKDTLDEIAGIMSRHASLNIEVHGHTCDLGGEAFNLGLSRSRARSVKTYLIESGVKSSRVISKGFGETRPITPNETEEDRRMNRRVEFYWLESEEGF